jgi:hypothetical protein
LSARARAEFLAARQARQGTLATMETAPSVEPRDGLWAALSVNHAVFRPEEAKDLNIEFSLINDGGEVLDPGIGDSRLIINGKELADSGFLLSNGPRDARFAALPPGGHLRFAYPLGKTFETPGVYRVSWRGAAFRSPEIVFRVLAADAD